MPVPAQPANKPARQDITAQKDIASHTSEERNKERMHQADTDHAAVNPKTMHSFGNISLHAGKPLWIQAKLSVNTPGDRYEQEADTIADKVMNMSGNEILQQQITQLANHTTPSLPAGEDRKDRSGPEEDEEKQEEKQHRQLYRKVSGNGLPADSGAVNDTLQAPGTPMDKAIRENMESRFGFDFSNVRIHNDPAAHRSAKDINALAYTYKNQIVFGERQYRPQTETGKRLLAHELTHVLQQQKPGLIQRDMLQRSEVEETSTSNSFPFTITITSKLTPDELLVEFIRQYHGNISTEEALAFKTSENWHWAAKEPTVKDADVAKGYKMVTVTLNGVTPIETRDERTQKKAFAVLSGTQQQDINDQTDKDFWDKTKYKPGQRLSDSADDKTMAKTWMQFRDRLVQEKAIIDKMPAIMKKIIVNQENYTAKDYEQLSRIITKLNNLSPEELADYINKITSTTDDLDTMESSVDFFQAELAKRKEEHLAREIIGTRLFGMEDIYDSYKKWQTQKASAAALTRGRGVTGEIAMSAWMQANQMESDLNIDLIKAGFTGGIPEFEKTILEFETAFELESQRIATDILDRYAHLLYEAEIKYSDDAEIEALYQAVGTTTAKADYEQADQIRSDHARVPFTIEEMADQSYWADQRNTALAHGKEQVLSTAGDHPLVGTSKFDHEALARASSKEEVKQQLSDYIKARKEDIVSARESIRNHPGLVYKTDELLNSSYQLQDIKEGSIYDKIIKDKIRTITIDEIILKVFVGVIAIALGLISMGGGTIGVLAAAGAFGIGAYQAVEEYRDYEMKKGLSGAELLSSDPSMFWVIAAVVAAGLDLSMVAVSLKALTPAIKVFNETHDVVQFEKSLAQLAGIDARLEANLARAARNEAQYQGAIADLLKVGGVRGYVSLEAVAADYAWRLTKVAYAALKRGVNSFEKFLLELKAQKIIDNIEGLTAEQKLIYKQAWLDALAENTRLSKIMKIGDRIPINAQDFAGRVFSFDLAQNPVAKARLIEGSTEAELAEDIKVFEALAKKYPDGVKFTSKGFPDFSPFTVSLPDGRIARFPLRTAGNRAADFTAADKMAGITEDYRIANKLVWHHVEDAKTIILIPQDVHNAVRHSGGISVIKNIVIEE